MKNLLTARRCTGCNRFPNWLERWLELFCLKCGGQFLPLIEWARQYRPTPEELEETLRSFAYGNLAIDKPYITRELVDKVRDEMLREKSVQQKVV